MWKIPAFISKVQTAGTKSCLLIQMCHVLVYNSCVYVSNTVYIPYRKYVFPHSTPSLTVYSCRTEIEYLVKSHPKLLGLVETWINILKKNQSCVRL